MHSSLTAAVLCIFAQVAAAECVVTAQLAPEAGHGAEMIKTSSVPTPSAAARPGGELIKSAAAGTRDTAAGPRPATATRATQVTQGEEEPPRSGTAMLLAALALMSGIALRRYSSNQQ